METLSPELLAFLVVFGFGAAFIDSVVGGGGLISLPALLWIGLPPHLALGTNKAAAVMGALASFVTFVRSGRVNGWLIRRLFPLSLVGSAAGVLVVRQISPDVLRPLVVVMLAVVLVYSVLKKDWGRENRYHGMTRRMLLLSGVVAFSFGFYDGFFGPGTGSFLIFLFIRFFGFDFLHASAASKVVNVATNLAAIGYFVPNGFYLPLAAIVMAAANVTGSFVGTHLALRHGSGFVRKLFLGVVSALIVKFAWDTFA